MRVIVLSQESDDNRIHVIDGGAKDNKITISINAGQTRYVAYNVSYYGFA